MSTVTVGLVGDKAGSSATSRAPAAGVPPPVGRLELSSPRMIVVVGTLSALIILLLFGAFAWRDRAQTFREAEVLTDDLAAVLAEHADRMFEMGDFVIGEAVRLAGPPDAPIPDDAATQRELLRLAELAPYVVSVWLGDAEGNAVLTSRRYPTPRLNAADRPYYRVPRDEPGALYIGLLPDNRYADAVLINMSRRIAPIDGPFRGFAQVSVSPDYIRSLYGSLRADSDMVFWLLDGRLRPLLREPPVPVDRLTAAPTAEAFAPARYGAAGSFRAIAPMERVERLYSFHELPGFDAAVVVGVAVEDVLAPWRGRLAAYGLAGLAAALAILGLTWVAWRQAARERALTRFLEKRVRERTADLEEALAQKDVLLREVNHRVKNSLQLVSSLLTIQAREAAEQPGVATRLAEANGRVLTIAKIHERLYRSDRADAVAFGPYLRELCRDLAASLPPQQQGGGAGRWRLVVEADEIDLPADMVVPLALVVNELVTNACKYAYPPGAAIDGEVRVAFHTTAGDGGAVRRLRLVVVDDGVGLPPGFDLESDAGMGMKLVRGLVRQLDGTCRAEPGRPDGTGTRFVVEVPAAVVG